MTGHEDIRIGTLVKAERNAASYIKQILPYGFESFQLTFWRHLGEVNLKQLAVDVGQSLEQGQQYEFRYRPQQNLSPEEQAVLNKPVSDLNLSVRARKCMNRLNIGTLGELVQRTADELLEAKNFGMTSLNEVRERLTQFNLKLRGD